MFSRSFVLKQLDYLDQLTGKIAPRLAAQGWCSDWKTIISILLSARTRDEVTIVVCEKLFQKYSSLDVLARVSLKQLEVDLKSINFFRNKAKSVFGCSRMLVKDFGGCVPRDFEKLLLLPGVGRKTANVFLSEFGSPAIGVDTHVFRISKKLGWSKSNTAEGVENDLKLLFLKSDWSRINLVLVRFGKTLRKNEDEIIARVKKI